MRRAFLPVVVALLCVAVWLAPKAQAAVPTITSVGTFTGSIAGGDTVTISGSNFSNITSVKFGNNSASYTVNTTSSITATSPAASSAGVVDIIITNNLGETGVIYGAFVYTDVTNNINRWIGGASGNTTNWNTPANWSKGAVPVSSDIIYINGSTYQPALTLTAATTFYALTLGPSSSATLTVSGGSLTNTLSVTTDLIIGKSGRYSPAANGATQVNSVVLNAARAVVASGGQLFASSGGYSSGNGPGGSATGGCSYAAYGINGKSPYGNIKQPSDLGSGCGGSAGGGFIKVTATAIQNDGMIVANGSSASSGGSIWLEASGQFSGAASGQINASSSGTGSGGRIAVYAGSSSYAGRYYAYSTTSGGGAGTIYTNIGSQLYGTLTLDNNNYAAVKNTPDTQAGSIQYDDFHSDRGAIYEIPSGTTLTLNSLPASVSSTDPGGIAVKGTLNVPNNTLLTNYTLYLGDGVYSDQNPVIGNASTIELQKSDPNAAWNIQSLTINSGGSLTHTANDANDVYAVNLNVSGAITVNSGGNINVTRKGYSIGNGPGKGVYIAGSSVGAGHGGYGFRANATYGNAYGSIEQPYESGSGGSNSGAGGGRIKLQANAVVNNGSLIADGGGSGYSGAAGGAGGSIWIDASTISGAGSMSVVGGNNIGAGGGRIALYFDTNSMSGQINMHSDDASSRGGSGTLYQKVKNRPYGSLSVQGRVNYGKAGVTPLMANDSHYESLNVGNSGNLVIGSGQTLTVDNVAASASSAYPGYIQNNGQLTVPNATTLVNYYVTDNGTYSDQNPIIGSGTTYELQKTNSLSAWNVNSLRVDNGGLLTHAGNTDTETYALNVVASNDITVNTGGSVNVVGKGYACSNGPGAGGPAITGYGNGGSYGGAGGRTNTTYPTVLYGSATQPTNSGSGGTCYSGTTGGGAGGGVAMLKSTSGNVIVNGTINANGATGNSSPYGSGGSGGSIWLQANTVTGNGILSANGANAYNNSGASGGGGRIAFTYYNNLQISSATPNKGKITGGDAVTLSGNGFSPNTLISFGSNSTTVTYNSATSLTVTSPAAISNGYVDITAKNKYFNGTVTVKGGTSSYAGTDGSIDPTDTYQVATLANGYEYAALTPVISSITPNYGVTSGGNTVTINGQNFMTNPSVEFGGVPATNVTFVSATQLTATVPAHIAGAVDVKVINSDGGSVTAPAAYTYSDPPTVSSISPTSGTTAGGDSVIINGTNFTASMTVRFGSNNATNIIVINDTTISATTPAETRGYTNVTVANNLTQSATLTNGYQYLSPPPQVTSFTPTKGTMAGGTTVTFTGTNLDSSMKAYFNGQAGTTLSATATTLRVQTPPGSLGNATVVIKGPDTEALTVATPFTYVPASYAFTTFPSSLHQTESGLIRLQARDTSNQPLLMTEDTVVALSSTSGTSQFSMSSNSGWGMTTVTIPAGTDHVDLYLKDTVKGSPTITATGPDNVSVSRSLTIMSRYKFLVTGVSDPINAGTPSSVTVQTIDWLGNPLNDYTGTIHFTSTDAFAQLPNDLQFTPEMQGNHTFVNGVTLITNGEHSVTVSDTNDSSITGTQTDITVQNGYAGPAAKLTVITDEQTVSSNSSTSAITVQIQDSNGNPAPAPVATQVYITASTSTGSFRKDEADTWTSGASFTVTIPAGATAASFYFKDTTIGNVTLSMRDQASTTDTALTDTEQTVTVGAGTPYRLAITTQDSQLANKWNPLTITLRDDQDRRLTVGQNPPTIYLGSSTGTVSFATDILGSNASTTFSKKLETGTSKLVVYIRSSSAQQATIHLSESQPANGSDGLLDDDKLVSFVTQQATRFTISASSTAAVDAIIPVTISGLNDNGDVAPVSGNKTISLSSTGSGMYSLSDTVWSTTNSIVIPDGSSSITIYYRNQTAGSATLYANSAFGQATRNVTITPATYSALSITGPNNLQVDTPTQYAVSLRDIYGNQAVSQAAQTAYLYTSSSTGSYATTASGPWTVSSVTIPAGSSVGTVYYKDSTLGASMTLTAGDQTPLETPDSGIANGTLGITTVGQTVSRLVITTPGRSVVAGSKSAVITVQAQTLDGSPARVGSNMTLSLTSSSQGQPEFYSDTGNSTAVGSITIPAGESEASFYYRDTKAGTFTLDALHGSGVRASQQIVVTAGSANDNGTLIFTTPAQTKESTEASDAIRIATADMYGNEATVNTDTIVTLDSDCSGSYSLSPTTWNTITTVTIAAGESAASVYFKSDTTCVLRISADGFTDGQQPYTIQNGPYSLKVDGPASLELNQVGTYTITLLDINGNSVASGVNRTLYLSGDGLAPDVSTIAFLAGKTSQTITARATAVQAATMSVRDEADISAPDTGLHNASATTSIAEGAPTQLGVVSLTAAPSTDNPSKLSVRLLNAYGGTVRAPNDITVALSSTESSGTYHASGDTGAPVITEITLPQNSSAVDVYYKQTSAGQAYLRATHASYASGELNMTTAGGAVVAYQLIANKDTIERGETVTYTVTALDANGNASLMHNGDFFYIDYSGGTVTSSLFNQASHRITLDTTRSAVTFTMKAEQSGQHLITVSDAYPLAAPDVGIADASHSLSIVDGNPAKLAFVNPSRTIERGGVTDVLEVQLQNAHGAATTSASDITISMLSGSPTGRFASSTGGPWTSSEFLLPAGESMLTLYYTDTSQPTAWQMSAATSTLTQASQNVTIVSGLPVSLHFVDAPASLVSYHDSPALMLELRNRYGYPTNKRSNDAVVLSTDAPTGEFADSNRNWQTNVLPWNASSRVGYSPTLYYRSYTNGINSLKASLPGITPAEHSLEILPQIMSHFVVTNVSNPTSVGVPSSIVVIAKDAAGYTVPSYAGTIHFAASDPQTVVPSSYTFVPQTDRGSHTFVNGVMFARSGQKTITVTDYVLGITGAQTAIHVVGEGDDTPVAVEPPDRPNDENTDNPVTVDEPSSPTPDGSDVNQGTDTPSSGQEDTNNPGSAAQRLFKPLVATFESVGRLASQVTQSKNAAYTVPTAAFSLFFGYTLLIALAAYREAKNASVLAAILRREKKVAEEKNEFINLLSHHLRTPIAIIAGTIDLMAFLQKDRDVTRLKDMSRHIQSDIDAVLASAAAKSEEVKSPSVSPNDMYRSARFWAPIAVAIIATLMINVAINSQSTLKVHMGAYLYQAALAVVAAVALYLALRGHALRKQEHVELTRQIRMRMQLDEAKNNTLDQLGRDLDSDLTTFEAIVLSDTDPETKEKLIDAESRLRNISDTAKVISNVRTIHAQAPVVQIAPYLEAYVDGQAQTSSRAIELKSTLEKAIGVTIDLSMLERVLDTVLKNADEYSTDPTPITVEVTASSEYVTIAVSNHGKTLPDQEALLQKPFIRGEGTLEETTQGLGLNLYADKLILESYGGELAMSSDGESVQTKILLKRT